MGGPTVASDASPHFRGLFVGINRYASPLIRNLAAAVRDAEALHALFSDNLGGDCLLLTDQAATTDRLRAELRSLQAACTEDDVVVITFSGHGSETHELVTYDTDLFDLAKTALPMDELTDLVSAIPAKHLLVVLDCCFSGGAGAKVLHTPGLPRGDVNGMPLSTEAVLERLAGAGRLILTASTAEQPAWEDARLGHGLLTHHLLEGLLGRTDGSAAGSQINLHDLLKFITRSVKERASSRFHAHQEPTLRGQWDGEVFWPVFTPGPLYEVIHPSVKPQPVTNAIHTLGGHGLPTPVLDRWAATLSGLNELQQDAVNEAGLLDGRNVLVMAPTSSGKTMIGELAALRATQNGGRSVFLLPTKALVNEQMEKFERVYSPIGVRTIRATGDFADQVPALLRGQFDIALLTYEKFSRLVLTNPYLLQLVSVVVIDEVQTLVDPTRGPELEFLLTLIKSRVADGILPQLVALSAVLGDLGGLDSWLDAYLLRRTDRPVPLEEGTLDPRGTYRYLDPDGGEQTEQLIQPPFGELRAKTLLIPLVQKLVADGQQVIVIRAHRGEVRGAAKYLADALGLEPAADVLSALSSGDPSLDSAGLRYSLEHGVAFHISDLDREERRIVEEAFRQPDSAVRVVVATTTLAQGVNLPAETVVMPELERRVGGRQRQPYSVAEYKNIAGRAGRLGLATRGRAIILSYGQGDVAQKWATYIQGVPEDVHSTLLDPQADMHTLVLKVIAVLTQRGGPKEVLTPDAAIGVLSSSFAAHQARLASGSEAFEPGRIAAVLSELQAEQFVTDDDSGLRLTPLGTVVAESGLAVRSAVTVAHAARQLRPEQCNRATLIALAQLTTELDATRLTVNVKGVQKEIATFIGELRRQRTAEPALQAISNAQSLVVAARAKKAVGCLLWMNGVPKAQLEQIVMQHYFDRSAIGPVRTVASRTQDVIVPVTDIVKVIHPDADLDRLAALLPIQLELGIPADFVPLAMAGADLDRQHYLAMAAVNLTTAELIEQADDDGLLAALGGSTDRLQHLRDAASVVLTEASMPTLEDVLPPPTD